MEGQKIGEGNVARGGERKREGRGGKKGVQAVTCNYPVLAGSKAA